MTLKQQLIEEIGYSKVYSITVALLDGSEKKLTDADVCKDYLNTDLINTDEAWYEFAARLCDFTGDPNLSVSEVHTNGFTKG